MKITDRQLRRAFPHRIPDSVRFGSCPACAGGGKTGPNFGTEKLYDIESTGTTVYRCAACGGDGKRTVHPS